MKAVGARARPVILQFIQIKMKTTIKYLIPLALVLTILSGCSMHDKSENKETYTLGIWTVMSGKEADFINEWTSFANWTGKNISGTGKAYLLRDEKNPLRFISFGPWDNERAIQKWRESDEFKSFVTKVKRICTDFQPNTLKVASTSE
jgi:heme-degrading monooxygenase HmoA